MAAEIIPMPAAPAEPTYWRCGCGNLTYFARDDGVLECAQCDMILAADFGSWRLPADVPAPPKAEGCDDDRVEDFMTISDDFGSRRFADRAGAGEFDIMVGITRDGGISTSCPARFDGESWFSQSWLRGRLDQALKMIL
jgi:hypothetical protein